jgi:hypothetical protein
LEATNTHGLPHPGYNPDPARSDSFLFGFLKGHLQGSALADEKDLISRFQAVFDGILESILILIDMTWIKRLRSVIKNIYES